MPVPSLIFRCTLWSSLIGALLLGRCAGAAETPDDSTTFFETQIRPALIEHCAECHWSDTEASGGLLLDSKIGWQEGGDLGPAIVPGDVSQSLLIKAIEYQDPALEMPPAGKLDDPTISAFRKWVREGAIDPRTSVRSETQSVGQVGLPVERAREHWAYRPLSTQAVSPFQPAHTGTNMIDVLVNRRILESGLTPSPMADRRELVRRLAFDLHGLPPSPEMVDAFVSDESPLAYQRLVDRLLASPRFAEHFARRWMDVVRYAESITLRGFVLSDAWRYRDYLVTSFNNDRPFDQMIRDQIAGDLIPCDDLIETQRRAVATGFLALGNSNLEDQDKTKLEFDHIDEQLETIGRAFLAQTIGCARCHDHKFDPIPTRDYYALAGIMRSTTPLKHANLSKWIEKPLPLSPADEAKYRSLEIKAEQIAAELKAIEAREGGRNKNAQSIVPIDTLDGVVVDDTDATFVGQWKTSTFVKPYVGQGYQHDETTGQGNKSVTFDPVELPTGRYEVRMSYSAHENRATNVRVKVFSANESTTVIVNQRKRPPEEGLWISLGVFPFERQGQSFVIVSNQDADGAVIVDAVQFRPVDDRANSEPSDSPGSTARGSTAEDPNAIAAQKKRLAKELKTVRAQGERRPTYLTVSESEPRDEIAIRIRGNPHQLGETVARGFLTAIGPAAKYADRIGSDGSGRVQLADWIADPNNPLTARVYANRVWCWLMGEGLVSTENNFGTTGQAPSHPELLDRLAGELIRQDWSTKRLVRMIVSSDAYRRAVTMHPDRMSLDPMNRLYASGSVKRIPVESLRDAMLFVSGELDNTMGGSTIRPGTSSDYNYRHDSLRRSVYLPVFRNSLPPLFKTFDFADSSVSVGQRSRSTVAPQSLAMLNHPWVIERAKNAARRFRVELGDEGTEPSGTEPCCTEPCCTEPLIDRLYLACFGRPPDADERRLCLDYLGTRDQSSLETRLTDLIQSLFASIDFRYLE